jgi:hypothetical protein
MKPSTACLFIGMLLAAGCAGDREPTVLTSAEEALRELRAAVSSEVRDSARAKQASSLVDEIEPLLREGDADLRAHNERIWNLNADYDATQEDFRAAFRDFNAKRDERQRRVLYVHQRAKQLLTAEEWSALGQVRERALEEALRAGAEG